MELFNYVFDLVETGYLYTNSSGTWGSGYAGSFSLAQAKLFLAIIHFRLKLRFGISMSSTFLLFIISALFIKKYPAGGHLSAAEMRGEEKETV